MPYNKDETRIFPPVKFTTEETFERMIFNTPELFEDIFRIKRQIIGGNKSGIPDIVGIDKTNGYFLAATVLIESII